MNRHSEIAGAVMLLVLVGAAMDLVAATPPSMAQPRQTQRQIDVCFCDDEDCAAQLVEIVDFAERSIHASIDAAAAPEVIDALLVAAERGVDVHLVLTLGRRGDAGEAVEALVARGAEVLTRRMAGETPTQHLVVDEATVVTGTPFRAADRGSGTSGAGEVWVARGVPELAEKMLERWEVLRGQATPVEQAEAAPAAHVDAAAPASAVYVTPSGKKYHRADCPYAKNGTPVSLEEARQAGKGPCRQCRPDDGGQRASQPAGDAH